MIKKIPKLKKRKSKHTARGKKSVIKSHQTSALKPKPFIEKKNGTRKQKQLKMKLKNIIENVIQQQRCARVTRNIPLTEQQRQRERFQRVLSTINPNGETIIPILRNQPNFIRPTRQFASILQN